MMREQTWRHSDTCTIRTDEHGRYTRGLESAYLIAGCRYQLIPRLVNSIPARGKRAARVTRIAKSDGMTKGPRNGRRNVKF